MMNLFVLLALNIIIITKCYPFESYMYPNNCNIIRDKIACNKEPGCGWCSNNGWDGIYECIQTKDDDDCNNGIAQDCIRSTRCYYCIFNIYATDYCFKSLYSPYKIYNI